MGLVGYGKLLPALALMAVWTSGCTHSSKDRLLPQKGPTMQDVYDAHFNRNAQRGGADRSDVARRGAAVEPTDRAGYTRDADHEVEQLFPRLPNPGLVMYVFPHLSERGYPVPGYSTTFPLYDKVHYALPGETGDR